MSRDADSPISPQLHARLSWLWCRFGTRHSKLHGRRYWCLEYNGSPVGALASDSPMDWRAEAAPRSLDRRALVRWLGRLAAEYHHAVLIQGLRCSARVLAAAIALCCDRSDSVSIDGATVFDSLGGEYPGLLVSGNRGQMLIMGRLGGGSLFRDFASECEAV